MNTKHLKTLKAIFQVPLRADVRWVDIESLILALGGEVIQGSGSRVAFFLNLAHAGNEVNVRCAFYALARAAFHAPHPEPTTDKGALKSVRRFLTSAGISAVSHTEDP